MFLRFWNKMQHFLPNIQKPKLSQQGQNHKQYKQDNNQHHLLTKLVEFADIQIERNQKYN